MCSRVSSRFLNPNVILIFSFTARIAGQGMGQFPLPSEWNQKVSTSIIYDAEFKEIKDRNDEQREPEIQKVQSRKITMTGVRMGAERYQTSRNTRRHMMLRRKSDVERVTAALDKNLVQWMDQQIDKGIYRSRTHCIEDCIRAKKT